MEKLKLKRCKELNQLEEFIKDYEENKQVYFTKASYLSLAKFFDEWIKRAGPLEQREIMKLYQYFTNFEEWSKPKETKLKRSKWDDDFDEAKKQLDQLQKQRRLG